MHHSPGALARRSHTYASRGGRRVDVAGTVRQEKGEIPHNRVQSMYLSILSLPSLVRFGMPCRGFFALSFVGIAAAPNRFVTRRPGEPFATALASAHRSA